MALFTTTAYTLTALVEDIDRGKIGLPDIQRPFVWPNTNVRNLFDSLYRGYPAGYLLFWDTGVDAELKAIGNRQIQIAPSLAIVDGQQRLTSLYAVTRGREVVRSNFKSERIRIAFNPLAERFDVLDASIVKDKAYIPDISVLWDAKTSLFTFVRQYLSELSAVRELEASEVDRIETAISRLHSLPSYSFTALTLNADVSAEVVAEVFVRINGEGKKLNQADFIMTLMSVFWDEGRAQLEEFSRSATAPSASASASAFNHFLKPSPDQMLRVGVGVGLKRARLQNVYSVLRGRDANTGAVNPEKREAQFDLLKSGQSKALNTANWHHFLSALTLAGYRNEGMITSETSVIFSYVLYLIGLSDFGIDRQVIRQAIAEFFFMAAITGRYTSSPETTFEFDLAQLRDAESGQDYLMRLRRMCGTALTNDFWQIQLPSNLANAAARSPARSAYQAALVKLGASALFSKLKVADMIDPAVKGSKAALEQHHLFPRAYLAEIGITEQRQYNQIANFAVVEWPDNLSISKTAPAEYAPDFEGRLSDKELREARRWHALPERWWDLSYEDFLEARRSLMAKVIREAWDKLIGGEEPGEDPAAQSIGLLIAQGEGGSVEFKSTLRTNLHTGQHDDKMHLAVLKTIAAFLNTHGGRLIIGVSDDGQAIGLEADGFASEDKMSLHLNSLIRDRIGDVFLPYVHPHFEDQDGTRVLVVRCERGPKPAFVKDGQLQRFYVRGGAATAELTGGSITDYVMAQAGGTQPPNPAPSSS
jgi:hypothetical protein